jgi:transcriptional regulator with XRE-family HTH domain
MDRKMITSQQMRAARALLGIDQRQLAELAQLSLPTIQRMEASDGQVRGGIELIGENASSIGIGRGVRLRENVDGKPANKAGSILFDQAKSEADAG